jgi:hypothetical protein
VVLAAIIVGPARYGLDGGTVKKITGIGQGGLAHVVFGDQGDDSMPLAAPAESDTAGPEHGDGRKDG